MLYSLILVFVILDINILFVCFSTHFEIGMKVTGLEDTKRDMEFFIIPGIYIT